MNSLLALPLEEFARRTRLPLPKSGSVVTIRPAAAVLRGAETVDFSVDWLEVVVHDVISDGSANDLANVARVAVMNTSPNTRFARLVGRIGTALKGPGEGWIIG